jgi:hypothetical protein
MRPVLRRQRPAAAPGHQTLFSCASSSASFSTPSSSSASSSSVSVSSSSLRHPSLCSVVGTRVHVYGTVVELTVLLSSRLNVTIFLGAGWLISSYHGHFPHGAHAVRPAPAHHRLPYVCRQLLRLHAVAILPKAPNFGAFNAWRKMWFGALRHTLDGYKAHTSDLPAGVLLKLVSISLYTVTEAQDEAHLGGASNGTVGADASNAAQLKSKARPPGLVSENPAQELLLDLLAALLQATVCLVFGVCFVGGFAQ